VTIIKHQNGLRQNFVEEFLRTLRFVYKIDLFPRVRNMFQFVILIVASHFLLSVQSMLIVVIYKTKT